jgi:hypothetical protein
MDGAESGYEPAMVSRLFKLIALKRLFDAFRGSRARH